MSNQEAEFYSRSMEKYRDKCEALEAKNGELEKKLEIAVEALEKIAWESNNDERIDWDTAREALKAINGGRDEW